MGFFGSILLCLGDFHLGSQAQSIVLLVADSILFPSMFLADALTSGSMMMTQYLLPNGNCFDANHVVLYKEISKGVGRTIGPPLARLCVDSGGQICYASLQVIIVLLFSI